MIEDVKLGEGIESMEMDVTVKKAKLYLLI